MAPVSSRVRLSGLSDLRGLPGHVSNSAERSLRGLCEAAGLWWPAPEVLPRWSARAREPTRATEPDASDVVVSTGWAAWEEYTRICRALARLPMLVGEEPRDG